MKTRISWTVAAALALALLGQGDDLRAGDPDYPPRELELPAPQLLTGPAAGAAHRAGAGREGRTGR